MIFLCLHLDHCILILVASLFSLHLDPFKAGPFSLEPIFTGPSLRAFGAQAVI